MSNLIPFEKIEAIILLSVCRFIYENELTKNSMLVCLSNTLRGYARHKGNMIDDSFRSTSGLSYQTNVMLNYLSSNGNTNRVPKMFIAASEQYENDPIEYEKKLWEGLIMSSESKKQAFFRFLTARRTQSASEIFWSLEKAEEYLKARDLLSGSLYEDFSLDHIERFESVILNDNSFTKKHKGLIYFLKLGFSTMKEYLVSENITEKNPGIPHTETNSGDLNSSVTSPHISETDYEVKTETLDNNHIDSLSIPVAISYYNHTVNGLESWADLYAKFMKIFWIEKGQRLIIYMGRSFINESVIDLGNINTTKRMKKPKKIADNVFIETNLAYSGILKRIKAVLDKTTIPAKRFSITYKQPISVKENIVPSVSMESPSVAIPMENRLAQSPSSTTTDNNSTKDIYTHKVNFNIRQELTYTKPVRYYYKGIYNNTVRNWTDAYTALFTVLWREHRSTLAAYIGKNLVGGNRMDLGVGGMFNNMNAPKTITDDYDGDKVFIETDLSAKDIVSRIKRVLEICHVPFDDVEIIYTKKEETKARMIGEPKKLVEKGKTSDNDFIDWLIDTCGLTERTANNYYLSVRRAESIAQEQSLASQRLLSADTYQEAQATYRELLSDQKFISVNGSSHNGFTASINKYLKYLLSGRARSHTSMSKPTKPQYDKELTDQCLAVLRESFTNGIKKDASIAKRRFRSVYAEKYGKDLSDDLDLDGIFGECALEHGGKFYATSTELINFIREQLKDYPVESDMLFYYDAFYDKNISQFSDYGIYSAEMLRSVLQKDFPSYHYKSSCFATHKGLTLAQVINATYGDDVCLSMDELQSRLPFIGAGQILPVLSRSNSGFVRVDDGTYAMGNHVHIAQSDVEKSKQIIEDDIRTQGYSFVKSLMVEDSEGENPEIPEQALQNVLFDLYLSNEFSRNRDLISPLGEADSIVNVLRNYCIQHKRITLKEVEEYEKEFTGDDSARRSLRVVTDAMIRVSEDTFVDQADFDIEAVDKAIEPFFRDRKVISLKNVSSFSVFPDVEELAWNSYLLASFLRRYSERWGYIGEEHNKKSVGAIFSNALTFDSYDDAIAQAVAEADIELTQDEVSHFLLHNEYRLRKADFKDIISKAYQIRMREE